MRSVVLDKSKKSPELTTEAAAQLNHPDQH
jgi:hypothetical protein